MSMGFGADCLILKGKLRKDLSLQHCSLYQKESTEFCFLERRESEKLTIFVTKLLLIRHPTNISSQSCMSKQSV